MDVILVTGNEGKAAEFQRMLPFPVRPVPIEIPEVQSIDVETVARYKAECAYAKLHRPVVVDDTGLTVKEWNGLPGALITWFLDTVGNEGLLRMAEILTDRTAWVSTSIGYCDGAKSRVYTGTVYGALSSEPRGHNGFGYDPIFIPQGYDRTFAELSDEEKDSISMRSIALDKFANELRRS